MLNSPQKIWTLTRTTVMELYGKNSTDFYKINTLYYINKMISSCYKKYLLVNACQDFLVQVIILP